MSCTWLAEGITGIVAVDLTDDVEVLRNCLDASDLAGEVCDISGEAVDAWLLGAGERDLRLVGEVISAGVFSATTVVRGAKGTGLAGPRSP